MQPWLPYECPEDVCNAVLNFKPARELASARPWNRTKPRETDWWLVPHADWPAYRFGKVWFGFGDPGTFEVALHVEKGLSADAAKALGFPAKTVTGRDWLWTSFLRDISSGLLADVVQRAASRSSLDAWFAVHAGPPIPEGELRKDSEYVLFSVEREPRVLEADSALKDLRKVRAAKSSEQLVEALGTLGEFVWVDLFVGTTFATAGAPADSWSGERLWEEWLEPLKRWFR